MKMSDKEMSHQDSALLFINGLQNELAKTKAAAHSQRYQAEPAPSQQIRRLQNPRGESESEHSLQPQGTMLTADQARRKPKDDNPDLFTSVGDEICRRPLFFKDADFLLFQCGILPFQPAAIISRLGEGTSLVQSVLPLGASHLALSG
jgi:hypothetical protein